MTAEELAEYKLHRRFDRMGRLVGDAAMRRLMDAHVTVVGIGGVGSWAAEALARSGVGRLTLIDFDNVCVTNVNRQLHAVHGTVGKKKVDEMAARLALINPRATIEVHPVFFSGSCADELFSPAPDHVVDAIDHVTAKCQLLAHCRNRDIPVVSATGSGGRLDPTQIATADLADTERDPLARAVRGILRDRYGFPADGPFGIPAVYSREPHTEPKELTYDRGKGFRCVCPKADNPAFTCDNRHVIYGNAGFVTGAFGLACASVVVRALTE